MPRLGDLDDGRDELAHEVVVLEQRRPVAVDEVDDEPLDVRAVVVLVGHDHEVAVAQRLVRGCVGVVLRRGGARWGRARWGRARARSGRARWGAWGGGGDGGGGGYGGSGGGPTLPCCSPRICLSSEISLLAMMVEWLASRTLSSLPRSGKTP